jgi:hypothetical protein
MTRMRIIIETTEEMLAQPHGGRGAMCEGHTEDGVPIVAVLTSIGCRPQHRAAFERSFRTSRNDPGARPQGRRRSSKRRVWRDRLLGLPQP